MKRRLAALTALTVLLLACGGTSAGAGPNCGTIESPCRIAGDTVPAGWSVGEVPDGSGRTIRCVVYRHPLESNYRTPAMSCSWDAR